MAIPPGWSVGGAAFEDVFDLCVTWTSGSRYIAVYGSYATAVALVDITCLDIHTHWQREEHFPNYLTMIYPHAFRLELRHELNKNNE